jgi:hypothetical protein
MGMTVETREIPQERVIPPVEVYFNHTETVRVIFKKANLRLFLHGIETHEAHDSMSDAEKYHKILEALRKAVE